MDQMWPAVSSVPAVGQGRAALGCRCLLPSRESVDINMPYEKTETQDVLSEVTHANTSHLILESVLLITTLHVIC